MDCIFTQRAEDDLAAIGDRIAEGTPARAVSFVQALRARCEKIAHHPKAFMVVDTLDGLPVRKARFAPYRIYYAHLEQEGAIAILHIRHDAMQDPDFSA